MDISDEIGSYSKFVFELHIVLKQPVEQMIQFHSITSLFLLKVDTRLQTKFFFQATKYTKEKNFKLLPLTQNCCRSEVLDQGGTKQKDVNLCSLSEVLKLYWHIINVLRKNSSWFDRFCRALLCTVVMTNKNLFNYQLILLHTCVCVTNYVPQTCINCIFCFYLQDWFLPLYLLWVKLCNRTRLYLIDNTFTINYLEYLQCNKIFSTW